MEPRDPLELVTVAHPQAGPLRRFADMDLQATIERAVAGTAPGKGHLIIDFKKDGANGPQLGVAIVQRVGTHLDVLFAGDKPWHGAPEWHADREAHLPELRDWMQKFLSAEIDAAKFRRG